MSDKDSESFEDVLVTTAGKKFKLHPVSDTKITLALAGIEKRYRTNNEPIDKPQYSVVTAGGGEEWHDHDTVSIKNDADAETAWKKYEDALSRLQAEQNERKMRMLLRGIEWEEKPEWEVIQKADEIEVPSKEEPEKRWYHFLTTEILETPEDFFMAVEKLTILTYKGAVSEEAIHAGIESFRSDLRKASTIAAQAQTQEQMAA